jgi:hypothetical protein
MGEKHGLAAAFMPASKCLFATARPSINIDAIDKNELAGFRKGFFVIRFKSRIDDQVLRMALTHLENEKKANPTIPDHQQW